MATDRGWLDPVEPFSVPCLSLFALKRPRREQDSAASGLALLPPWLRGVTARAYLRIMPPIPAPFIMPRIAGIARIAFIMPRMPPFLPTFFIIFCIMPNWLSI